MCHVDYPHILGNTFGLIAFGTFVIIRDGFAKFFALAACAARLDWDTSGGYVRA